MLQLFQSLSPGGWLHATVISALTPLCMATSILMFSSPYSALKEVQRKKSVGELAALPIIMMATGCCLGTLYGIENGDMAVVLTNGFGAMLGLNFVRIYYHHSAGERRMEWRRAVTAVTTFLLVLLWIVFFVVSPPRRVHVVGTVGTVFAILSFASPLATIGTVVRTKSSASIAFHVSLMSTVCSASWLCYGLLKQDPYTAAPNAIGLILCLMQLALFAVYPDRS